MHEEWLLHKVDHFDPAPVQLSPYEARTILGFRWWRSQELTDTTATIFPPQLGGLMIELLTDGAPTAPIDISERAPAAAD